MSFPQAMQFKSAWAHWVENDPFALFMADASIGAMSQVALDYEDGKLYMPGDPREAATS